LTIVGLTFVADVQWTSRMRVLMVGELKDAAALREGLKRERHEVVIAKSPLRARSRVLHDEIDLIGKE
jgi:hypothetical protein